MSSGMPVSEAPTRDREASTRSVRADFCGWIGAPCDAPDEVLRRMLPGEAETIVFADSAVAAGPGIAVARQGHLVAIIAGRAHFSDPGLEQQARASNPAQVLLQEYQSRIGDSLSALRGSFALALIDNDKHSVLLAVDRFGIERLLFAPYRDGAIFATSADILVRHPALGAQVSPQGLFHYVYFHNIPSPNSIYRHVNKLKAGEQVHVGRGRISGRPVRTTRFVPSQVDEVTLANELRGRLEQAVRRELDRPAQIGAFLSGGLDSSTVTGYLAKLRPGERVKTFTMGFSAKGYDESEYARAVASHFKTEHHEYYVTPDDVIDMVPRIATHLDEPFGNSSALPAYYCARLAKEHGITTLLAGDGGDELFAGNTRYAKQGLFENYFRIPEVLRRYGIEAPLALLNGAPIPLLDKAASYVNQAKVPLPDRLQTYNFLHQIPHDTMFAPDFLSSVDVARPLKQLRECYWGCEADSYVDRMLHLDWKFTLADNDLVKVSSMCELAGVAVRYPMLDDELVEFSTRIPAALKLRGQNLRYFYKRALTGFLPDSTINKSKHGFGLPFGVWMRTEPALQALAYDSLSNLKRRGFFQDAFIDQAIAQHRNGHASYYGELVWVLMMLELWLASHSVAA